MVFKTAIALALSLFSAGTARVLSAGPATLPADNTLATQPSHEPSAADRRIIDAEGGIKHFPGVAGPYVMLSSAFMHKARETADGAYYVRAEAAAQKALDIDAKSLPAQRQMAWVFTGEHRFPEARDLALHVISLTPRDSTAYGLLGDSLIELGDYDGAEKAVQKMVDIRADLAALTRVSYLRELFGDTEGAVEMMVSAIHSVSPREPEYLAWCESQLGNLQFNSGHLADAEAAYQIALHAFPNYHYALTGMGRVRAAQKNDDEAISYFRKSLEIVPMHETVVSLGDLLLFLKRPDEAAQQFALVEVIEQLNRANKIQPEAPLILFYADHDRNLPEAVALGQTRAAERQDIRTMDALSWALYKTGKYEDAAVASAKSLRLGTRDANFYFHAGMIQMKLNHRELATMFLHKALATNPFFHPQHADEARATLATLQKQ